MLEEIVIPSMITDQPNDNEVDDDTVISIVNIIILKDAL